MKALIDLHTHTLVSGHAYSTIKENVKAAKLAGLKYIGLSEHAPNMPASPHAYYFQNVHVIPKEIDGVRVIQGIEANILDYDGNIDVTPDMVVHMNYMLVSLHPPCITAGTKEENTNAVIKAMDHEKVKIVAHLDDSRYPVDYEKVVKAAKEKNIAFEVNNSSLKPNTFREGAWDNVKVLLKYCKEYGVNIIMGSDAHICYDVGKVLGCGGHMSFLLRTSSGKFNLENGITLEELKEYNDNNTLDKYLYDIDYVLTNFNKIKIHENAEKYYINGGIIDERRFIEKDFNENDEFVRVYSSKEFIGIGKIIRKNNTISVKSDKLFIV